MRYLQTLPSKSGIPNNAREKSVADAIPKLEAIPGVGPTRRRALLRELGSLRAVREATVEQLASVTGISPADAERIRRFFASLEASRDEAMPASA
jgi:excinuclease ABC subunit C